MSNYTKSTNFATKDNLPTGDPLKIVKGTEIDTEFNNIATAISTKTDNASAAITGGSITGITDLAIADGGTGASTATAAINNLLPSQTSNANKYLQTDGTNVSWDAISINTGDITGTLPVANGGTGVTSSTGTGSVVLSNSPTLVTPSLGAATASTLDVSGNVTLSGGTANTIPYLNGSKVVTTGTELYFNGTNLGVGASASYRVDLGSATSDDAAVGIRIGRGGSSTTWSLIDNVGGSGNYRQYSSGTPTLRWLTSTNGTSWSEQMRLNATGLGVGNNNPTEKLDVTGSALVSGSVTASQFYGSFNGAIGNTTAYSGAFTSLTTSSTVTINGGTANGVAYLNGSKVLTTGSVIKFDGTNFTSDRSASTAYSGTNQATWANGIVLNNSATPATGILDSIYFSNNANMQNVFGVVQNSSGYGDFVWAGNSGSYAEWMRLSSSGLTLTSNPTLSGGTANGVTYLNGSKVLTSGSALTFDGTNLGVGGTAGGPATVNIQIKNASSAALRVTGGSGTNTGFDVLQTSDGVAYLWNRDNQPVSFGTNATEGMRLTSTGLGIGTSSPSYRLQARSSGTSTSYAGNIVARLESNGAGYSSTLQFSNNVDASATLGLVGTSLGFGVGTTQMLTLDSAGNLGLGVTPSAWADLKSFDISGWGSLFGFSNQTGVAGNAYYNAGWKYKAAASNPATRYEQNSAGIHSWHTAPSGTAGNAITFTQAMTLDASGQFLLGTTSALAWTSNTYAGTSHITVSGSGEQNIGVVSTDTNVTRAKLFVASGGQTWGLWNDGSALKPFVVGGYTSEWMRIDSSGNLLIGATSVVGSSVSGLTLRNGGTSGNLLSSVSSTASRDHMIFYNPNGVCGSLYTTGTTFGLYNASDMRLKQNIDAADNPSALIDAIQVRKFDWKVNGEHQRYGFIAQELATVFPEAVKQPENSDEMMGVDYSKLVPMLVKEIQSLRQRVAQLETN